jgi:hypothetical protein
MTISANYPNLAPSLSLDFANSKALDPRITFSRPTTATYYNSYSSAVAEQNLFLQSQNFGTSWTASANTVTINTTTAPDGTTTASSLIPTASTTQHYILQGITNGATTTTISAYAKPNGYNFLQINVYNTGNYANFDVSGGTVTQSNGLISSAITSVGSGWYRCSITLTTVVNNTVNILFMPVTLGTVTSFPSETTNGTSGIFLWGAQLEQRSAVTAYNATTTTAITNYIPVLQTAVANEARFDHNPTTRESLGLLIEEQRTNLLLQSSNFSAGDWTKSSSTVTGNTIVVPDGTQTGQWVIGTAAGERIQQSFTATATTKTISLYVKSTGYAGTWATSGATLLLFNSTTSSVIGNVAFTGSTFTPASGGTTVAVGNGWYRISITVSSGITVGNSLVVYVYTDNTQGNSSPASLFAWGAQLEAGAFATSYIPTVASQVTRSADSASMTGTNFSSWYNPSEGTLYAEAKTSSTADSIERVALQLLENGQDNFVTVGSYNGQGRVRVFDNGSNQATLSLDSVSGFYKVTGTYKTNDVAGVVNGGTVSTDTSVTLASFNRLNTANIGQYYIGSRYINGTIKKLAYYPIRVTNANLQAITGS